MQVSCGLENTHAVFCIPAGVLAPHRTCTMKAQISKHFPILIISEQWVVTALRHGTNPCYQASFLAGAFSAHVFKGRKIQFEWNTHTHDSLAVRRQESPHAAKTRYIYSCTQPSECDLMWSVSVIKFKRGKAVFRPKPQKEREKSRLRVSSCIHNN